MSGAARTMISRRAAADHRMIITPEGIPLGLRLADASERATAFLLDFLVIIVMTVGLAVLVGFAFGSSMGSGWQGAFVLLANFLIRNFYFMYFELRWQGSTPGKKVIGLRVIDGKGGPLVPAAVVARNLVRDLEVFLPLVVLIQPEQLWAGATGWARVVAALWVFVIALMPLFNKDRLRVGDLIGGTIVVLAPKMVLLPDLGARGDVAQAPATYVFTDVQLDVYGIYELQVLENVLRSDAGVEVAQTLDAVCDRIKHKIGWPRDAWSVHSQVFLSDFYAAMRARLEHKMLFGKRREDKYSTE